MKWPFLLLLFVAVVSQGQQQFIEQNGRYTLTAAGASHLAGLPLKCLTQQFPYKTGVVFADTSLIQRPVNYHPAFYGCFDWHSSVHGHWMLIRLVKKFPNIPQADTIRNLLLEQLSYRNIQGELKVFQQKDNRTFERTYGWAWLLQMQKELLDWDDTLATQLSSNLQPLADLFSQRFREFLDKLVYPLRVGEHSNLAFSLCLAWDYARTKNDDSLLRSIQSAAMKFYQNDAGCPISWEPGGTDFLSPCLEEADLMWRILPSSLYEGWLQKFLPVLFEPQITLVPGQVKDRSDGRLVHLDGLNFSRAWCLYGIAAHVTANRDAIIQLANKHLQAALPHVASGEYMGEHWLASFAVYALAAEIEN